jgi:NIMA (never in mitosis gene a)-related kinase
MVSFSHPNIIGYKESFIDDQTSTLCVVMEHADAGDILSKVNEQIRRSTTFPEA